MTLSRQDFSSSLSPNIRISPPVSMSVNCNGVSYRVPNAYRDRFSKFALTWHLSIVSLQYHADWQSDLNARTSTYLQTTQKDSGKPRRQETTLCDIQIKVVIINFRQIYVYHSDLLPLKILVTLTLTFQGHPGELWGCLWIPYIWFCING